MATWLEQASQRHEMYYHNLEVMGLNSGQVEVGLHSTSILNCTWTKNNDSIFIHQSMKDMLHHFHMPYTECIMANDRSISYES